MKTTFKNILPIIIPSLSLQMIEFGNMAIDSIMVGRYDPLALGGTSLASTLFLFVFVFFLGVILMVGPLVAQASGAKNNVLIVRTVRSACWVAIFSVITIVYIMSYTESLAAALGFDKKTTQYVLEYMTFKKLTAVGLLILPYRFFLTNQKVFKPIIILSLISLPINALLNWALIYGNLGFDEMGVYGAGLATFISICISVVLIISTATYYANSWGMNLWIRFWKIDFEIIKRILKFGFFIGLMIMIELSLFGIGNIFVAGMDIYSIAAFGVMFQVWNLVFGIQMGIAEGANLYTAYEAGAKRYAPIIKGSIITAIILLIVNVAICSTLYFTPETLYYIFLKPNNPDTISIMPILFSINLLLLILVFLESIIQLPSQLLKSINDTKYLPVIQAIGYLLVAPSVMYITTRIYDYGIFGIMFGMLCGMIVTSSLVTSRLLYSLKPENIFKYVETK